MMRSDVGEDCIQSFFESLSADVLVMWKIVLGSHGDIPMLEDADDPVMAARKREAKECCFCDRLLPAEDGTAIQMGETRVWDHDHFTGETRGVAHSSCNIKASLQKHYLVPVVFHNLRGYDSYHIIQGLAEWPSVTHLDVIAKSVSAFI